MKTFKKLFSVSAIVALLGTLMPIYAFGANYTTELVQAYDYAHDHGITTMSSIDNADMYGNLTRIAMAKMLANYAIDVLGLTPDTTKECTFPDVTAALDAQYDNGVTKACQLGLMGVGIKNFNPNGIVTRAEFGTAFSRALNANDADKLAEMNKADPYYKEHLNFLKEEGIMNNISDPNMVEVRGYVMLMMMRSDDSYTPTEGCSAEELLKCLTADDYDACVAACSAGQEEEEEVANGFVTISKVSAAATQEVAMNASKKNVGTIKLTAGEDGATVSSIVVKRDGLGSNNVAVELTNDKGTITTAARNMNSNGEATVRFSPALTLKANESIKLNVLVTLNAAGNEVHNFSVTSANLAKGKSEGTAVLGSLKTLNYSVTAATVNVTQLNGGNVKAGETKAVAKVTITPSKDAIINGFTLSKGAAAKQDFDKAFGEVKAYVNNKEVGKVTMTSDKIIVSDLNTEKSATSSLNVEIRVSSIFIGATSDTILSLDSTADIDVIEKATKESVQANATSSATVNLLAAKISSQKVTTGSVTYAPATQGAILYNAKFTSNTDFDVIGYEVSVTPTTFDITKYEGNKVTLTIGDVVADIEASDLRDNASCSDGDYKTAWKNNDITTHIAANCTNGVGVFVNPTKTFVTFGTNDSFTVANGSNVVAKITANIKDNATALANTIFTITLTKLRDVSNSSNVIDLTIGGNEHVQAGDATSIALGTITLKAATVAAPASRNVWSNASDLEVGRFAVTADAEDVSINKVTVTNAGTTMTQNLSDAISSAKLVVINEDGTEETIATASNSDINDGTKTITFEDVDLTVKKDVDTNIKIVVSTKTVTANDNIKFNVKVAKEDAIRESGEAIAADKTYSALASAEYTFGIKSPTVTLKKINDSLFKVTIKNEDGTNAMNLQSVDVRIKAVADNSSYKGNYCLRQEGSSETSCSTLLAGTDEGTATTAFAVINGVNKATLPTLLTDKMIPGAARTFKFWNGAAHTLAPVVIAKNASYTFEVYVDSDYVNPTTLMAEFTKATYAEGSESYELTAQ